MSKIGKQPIIIPEAVKVSLEGDSLKVVGPKGQLELKLAPKIKVEIKEKEILVKRLKEDKQTKANHGTLRQLMVNMIQGVKEGWTKVLEIQGTGFRAKMEGEKLILSLGFSHPVEMILPEGIECDRRFPETNDHHWFRNHDFRECGRYFPKRRNFNRHHLS